MPPRVEGIGPLAPKLMIIGEAPGKNESISGKPFVGASGEMLDEFLHVAGISRHECYITNVVKYQPPMNDLKKLHLIGVDIEQSVEELWAKEIRVLKPNCILAVGNLALNATTGFDGILDYRGSILAAKDGVIKVVPTVHPAALFNRYDSSNNGEQTGGLDYVYTKLIQHDITRAVEESKTSRIDLPDRHLSICHSSLDLSRFCSEYASLEKAAVDIESINCVPVCVGFAFNRHHAISVPLIRSIGKHKLTDMSIYELEQCWRLVDELLRRVKIIGQNFKYDDFKLSLIGFLCKNVYSDTLIKTRVIFPELPDKRLSTIASLWTREPYYKEEGKEFKIGKSPVEQLLLYNGKDCCVEYEVDEEQEKDLIEMAETYKVPLVEYYYNYMMKKHKFYLEMENVGFGVDHDQQNKLKKKYTDLQNTIHTKLTEMIGYDVNVKSYPQMNELLYKAMRFKALKKNPTSEDALVRLLGSHAKKQEHKDILTAILEERRIRDQKSRYINFCPDYDGRAKTSFNISATETCRSSTSVLKKPVRPKKIGLAFHTISKHGRLAKDIRTMFIPDKGKVFLQLDSSQAEARVVAVLSEDYELLEAFDRIDIHRRTAGLIFGYSQTLNLSTGKVLIVDDLDKEGPERFCGKKTRHAGNYRMGKSRFMTEFNTDAQKFEINMTISEWRAGQMLKLFHEASPKLSSVFHAGIEEAIKSTRVLIDPFGGVRVFNGRMDDELFKEGYANIPQRTIAHLVQGAALSAYDDFNRSDVKDWCFISENHDSLLMQVPANNWEPYARTLKKYMTRAIDFSTYCTLKRNIKLIIPCDVEISDTNYAEMKKVKL